MEGIFPLESKGIRIAISISATNARLEALNQPRNAQQDPIHEVEVVSNNTGAKRNFLDEC
jgi:hypothetical protein